MSGIKATPLSCGKQAIYYIHGRQARARQQNYCRKKRRSDRQAKDFQAVRQVNQPLQGKGSGTISRRQGMEPPGWFTSAYGPKTCGGVQIKGKTLRGPWKERGWKRPNWGRGWRGGAKNPRTICWSYFQTEETPRGRTENRLDSFQQDAASFAHPQELGAR